MEVVSSLLAFIESSKYILLFIGSYLEGSVVIMTGGFLLHLREVELIPLFIALYTSDILSDITLYFVGYFGGRRLILRYGHLFKITPAVLEKVEHRFHLYHTSILIISKLTMGLGFAYATLISAGMLRISFFRYIVINAIGGLIWIPFLICVGYFFGNVFEYIPGQFKIAFIIVLVTSVLLLLRYLSRRFAELE
jgi:membrane protein DedA with SNARE-associated domain